MESVVWGNPGRYAFQMVRGVCIVAYVIELRRRFVAMGEDICQKRMLIDRGNHGTGGGLVR